MPAEPLHPNAARYRYTPDLLDPVIEAITVRVTDRILTGLGLVLDDLVRTHRGGSSLDLDHLPMDRVLEEIAARLRAPVLTPEDGRPVDARTGRHVSAEPFESAGTPPVRPGRAERG